MPLFRRMGAQFLHRDRGIFLFTAAEGVWFDDFRSDPRFEDLLRRMHFPQMAAGT